MTVTSIRDAWAEVQKIFPTRYEHDASRSERAGYDDAVKGGSRSMTEAMNLTPWVWRLQEADMCAAWIDERSAEE